MDRAALDRHITDSGEPKRSRFPRSRFWVGVDQGTRTVFSAIGTPTAESHPYAAAIGPFRTKAGAEFMRDHGANNPHCQTVADAERLAKLYATKEDRSEYGDDAIQIQRDRMNEDHA